MVDWDQGSNIAPTLVHGSFSPQYTPYSAFSSFQDQKLSSDPETPVSPISLTSPTSTIPPIWEEPTQPSTTSSAGTSISDLDREQTSPISPVACAACLAKSQTYLMEIINYPSLKHAHTRHQVLTRSAFDAIILVYDVGNRTSFDYIKKLHAEIRAAASGGKRGKVSSGTAVVIAVAGNKCDLDGDEDAPVQREEERGSCDEKVGNIDDALALFGPELLGEWRGAGKPSAPPTPSEVQPPRPALTRSNTLDEFLQLGKSAEIVTNKAVSAGTSSSGSQTAVHNGRQVSNVDGEGLALDLATPVPFFETSAKTGENVEEMFEAVAKAVLKGMGRGEVNKEELAKKCSHRTRTDDKNAETRWKAENVATRLEIPSFESVPTSRPGQAENNGSVQQLHIKTLDDGLAWPLTEHTIELQPTSQPEDGQRHQIRGRDGMMDRMRKLFMKREPAVAEGLALQDL